MIVSRKDRVGQRAEQGEGSQRAPFAGGATAQSGRANARYRTRPRRRKRKIVGVLLAAVALAVGCFGFAFANYVTKVNDSLQGGQSQEELDAIDAALTGEENKDFDQPFYMLLLGSDARIDDASMGQRSDTNILARIDASTGTVTLVSIPRDTAIDLNGYGTVKFNSAFAYGGTAGAITAASNLLNVDIAHYAELDFDGLADVIDSIGGVDVYVSERIDDPDAGDIAIEAGEQHLDGAAALVFARSRAYTDGDYTRMSNQRELLQAVIDKVLAMPATQVPQIVSTAAKSVTTDLNLQDIASLAAKLRGCDKLTVYSATIPSSCGYIGDISYVFADQNATAAMMAAVEAGEDPQSATTQGAAAQQSLPAQ